MMIKINNPYKGENDYTGISYVNYIGPNDSTLSSTIKDVVSSANRDFITLDEHISLENINNSNLEIVGNVGIGKTDPQYELDVSGSGNFAKDGHHDDELPQLKIETFSEFGNDAGIDIIGARNSATYAYNSYINLKNYDTDISDSSSNGINYLATIRGFVENSTSNIGGISIMTTNDGTRENLKDGLVITKDSKVGIGKTNPSTELDVSGVLNVSGGSKIVIQGGTDGGTNRGIYMWTNTNTDWGIYMATSGSGKSLSGASAVQGYNGFTGSAIRFRAWNNSGGGFIFENSSEQLLHSINGNTGDGYFKGTVTTTGLQGYTFPDFSFTDFAGTIRDTTSGNRDLEDVIEMGKMHGGGNFICLSNQNVHGTESPSTLAPEGFTFYNVQVDGNGIRGRPRLLMYISGVHGNVGIKGNLVLGREQKQNNNTYKLDVVGDINFTGSLYQNDAVFSSGSDIWSGTADICYNGGNVGIGTNNPSSKLDVNGNIKTMDDLVLKIAGTDNDLDDTNSIVFTNTGGNYTWRIGRRYLSGRDANSKSSLVFSGGKNADYTLLSDYFTITSTGNVGIGTTEPSSKLDVNGNLYLNNGSTGANQAGACLRFDNGFGMRGPNKINLHSNTFGFGIKSGTVTHHSSEKHAFYYGGSLYDGSTTTEDGTLAMIIDTSNVGINTSSPQYNLDVNGIIGFTTGDSDKIMLTYIPEGSKIAHGVDWTVDMYAGSIQSALSKSTGSFRWFTGHNRNDHVSGNVWIQQMVLDTSGNLGVGITEPKHKLEVNGSGKISDKLSINKISPSAELDVIGNVSINKRRKFRYIWIRLKMGAFNIFELECYINNVNVANSTTHGTSAFFTNYEDVNDISSVGYPNYPPSEGVDGINSSLGAHTINDPSHLSFLVDLSGTYSYYDLQRIIVYNRTTNTNRYNGTTDIQLLDENKNKLCKIDTAGTDYTNKEFINYIGPSQTVYTGPSKTSSNIDFYFTDNTGGSLSVEKDLILYNRFMGPVNFRYIWLQCDVGITFQLWEVECYIDGVNVALSSTHGTSATFTSNTDPGAGLHTGHSGHPASRAIDGHIGENSAFSNEGSSGTNNSLLIDLSGTYSYCDLQRIIVYTRHYNSANTRSFKVLDSLQLLDANQNMMIKINNTKKGADDYFGIRYVNFIGPNDSTLSSTIKSAVSTVNRDFFILNEHIHNSEKITIEGHGLDVNGNINFTGSLYQNGAVFSSGSNIWSGTADICYNGGNVGIGTNNPSSKLDVNGNIKTMDDLVLKIAGPDNDLDDTNSIFFTNTSGSQNWRIGRRYLNGRDANHYSSLVFSGGKNADYTLLSDYFTITSTGNVGIGTTEPSSNLHIKGNAGDVLQTWTYGSRSLTLTAPASADSDPWVWTTSNAYNFIVDHNSVLYINDQGCIGIGTNNPSQKLDVNGTVKATTFSGSLSGNANTVTNGVYTAGTQSIGGAKTFTSTLTVDPGTGARNTCILAKGIDPDFKLVAIQDNGPNVDGGKMAGIGVKYKPDGSGANDNYDVGSIRFLRGGSGGTGHISFSSNNTELMRIKGSGGNVGIGTNNPSQKLEVNGTVKATTYTGALASAVTATTQGATNNSTKVATTAFVQTAISNLVASAPEHLNTLGELATALSDGNSVSTALTTQISGKVSKTGDTISGNLSFATSSLRQMLNLWGSSYGIGIQSYTTYFRTGSQFQWYKGGSHNDDKDHAGGGTSLMKLDTNGTLTATTFSGSGASLTNINASNISSGTLPVARLDTNYLNLSENAISQWYNNTTSKINVNGFIYTKAIINSSETGSGPAAITFGDGQTSGTDQISLVTSGETRLYVNSSGNIGIGTNNPSAKLDVSGSGRFTSGLTLTNNNSLNTILLNESTQCGIKFGSAPGDHGYLHYYLNNPSDSNGGLMVLGCRDDGTSGTLDRVSIMAGVSSSGSGGVSGYGYVGINTLTPTYNLDVNGNINFTGTLYHNGAEFSGGGGGSADTATTANKIKIQNRNSNSTDHYLLFASGNGDSKSVYVDSGIKVNPTDNKIIATTFDGDLTGEAGSVTNGVYTNTTQTISGAKTFSNVLTATGGSKIVIQNSNDNTGGSRGIYLWSSGDTNWGIYMSRSGGSRSLDGVSAVAGHNSMTNHAVRFRAGKGSNNGFIFENSDEELLHSINSSTGDGYFKGTVTATTFDGDLTGEAGSVTNGVYTTGTQSIGGSKTFTSPLSINGSISDTTPILRLKSGNGSTSINNNGSQISFGYNGTNEYQHFINTRHSGANSNNAIDFFVCDSERYNTVTSGSIHTMSLVSGNVGIGTTTPSQKLDVNGSISAAKDTSTTSYFGKAAVGYCNPYSDWASFAHVDSNVAGEYALLQNSNGKTILNAASGQDIQFNINNSYKMILKSNGNFGIGTSSPSTKLDVNGTVKATTFSGSLSGNATTATKLQTARKIGNVLFDGTNDIIPNQISISQETNDLNLYLLFCDGNGASVTVRPKTNSAINVNPGTGTITAPKFSGALASDVTAETQVATNNSTKVATTEFVQNAISGFTTTTYVDSAIAGLVDSAPDSLNTLNELATALSDGNSVSTALTTQISGKVSKSGDTISGNLVVTGSISAGKTAGSTTTTSFFGNAAVGYCGHDGWAGFSHVSSNVTSEYALLQHSNGQTLLNAASGQPIYFRIQNNTKMTLTSAGNLEVNGTVTATNFVSTSDRNLKENIVALEKESVLEKVSKLNGYQFNFKSDETKKTKTGLIAQEVEEVMPELVVTNETNQTKSMDYSGMIPYLVECIKVQKTQIESQQQQLQTQQDLLQTQQDLLQKQQEQINMLKEKIENM